MNGQESAYSCPPSLQWCGNKSQVLVYGYVPVCPWDVLMYYVVRPGERPQQWRGIDPNRTPTTNNLHP